MQPFRRDVDCYRAQLTEAERAVLGRAVADVSALLVADSGRTTSLMDPASWDVPGARPEDPAVARLLPDGSREDADIAAEFRRLTEDDLRRDKISRLERLRAALSGDELVVPFSGAEAAAAAMTDVRLVLAERLGLRSDEDAAALYEQLAGITDGGSGTGDDDAGVTDLDARLYLGTVYTALSWLQESLLEVMLEDLGTAPGDGVRRAGP